MIEPTTQDVPLVIVKYKSGKEESYKDCAMGWQSGFMFIFYTTDRGSKEVWIQTDEIERLEIRRYG